MKETIAAALGIIQDTADEAQAAADLNAAKIETERARASEREKIARERERERAEYARQKKRADDLRTILYIIAAALPLLAQTILLAIVLKTT